MDETEITRLKTKTLQLNNRLISDEKLIADARHEVLRAKTNIANLKRDIVLLKDSVQDASHLKQQVKVGKSFFSIQLVTLLIARYSPTQALYKKYLD